MERKFSSKKTISTSIKAINQCHFPTKNKTVFCRYFSLHWKKGENEYIIAEKVTFSAIFTILPILTCFQPFFKFFAPVFNFFPKNSDLIYGRVAGWRVEYPLRWKGVGMRNQALADWKWV